MEVYISANAFWALLISTIEVYKRECFGLLLGYRDSNNIYIVDHAISYQTANRRHTSVEKNGRASRRMNKFLANLPHLSVIGDFHSHTGWGDLKGVGALSTQDIYDMSLLTISAEAARGSTTVMARSLEPLMSITSALVVIISMISRESSAQTFSARTPSDSTRRKASRQFY
jgi:hypothetical protein